MRLDHVVGCRMELLLVAIASPVALPCGLAAAWPGDSLTHIQVSPAGVGSGSRIQLGPDGSSTYMWFASDLGPPRIRGLDRLGGLEPAWPESGLVIESDPLTSYYVRSVRGELGSAIVLWGFLNDFKMRAQRFRAGAPLWGDTGIVLNQQRPTDDDFEAIPDGRGGLYFAWSDRQNFASEKNLYFSHVDSNGVHRLPADVAVCTAPGFQGAPRLLMTGDRLQVLWRDNRTPDSSAFYTQRFDDAGLPMLQSDGVRVFADHEDIPFGIDDLVADGSGGVYYTFGTRRFSFNDSHKFLCRLDSTGAAAAGWPALGVPIPIVQRIQDDMRGLTVGPDGHVLVCWYDPRSGGMNNAFGTLWLQRFTPEGVREWSEERIGLASRGSSDTRSQAIPDGAGGFFLCYTSDQPTAGSPDVSRVQHVDRDATQLWGSAGVTVCAAISHQEFNILPDGAGGLLAAWRDDRLGAGNEAIFAAHVNADGTLGGSVTATDAAAISSRFEDGCAHVMWHTSESAGIRFDIERARGDGSFTQFEQALPDGSGFIALRDCDWGDQLVQRYRLSWSEAGERRTSAPVVVRADAIARVSLGPIAPMPVVGGAQVTFSLTRATRVRLVLHDLAGREVARLLEGTRDAGEHRLRWDPSGGARRLSPGAYLLTLTAGDESHSRRIVLFR